MPPLALLAAPVWIPDTSRSVVGGQARCEVEGGKSVPLTRSTLACPSHKRFEPEPQPQCHPPAHSPAMDALLALAWTERPVESTLPVSPHAAAASSTAVAVAATAGSLAPVSAMSSHELVGSIATTTTRTRRHPRRRHRPAPMHQHTQRHHGSAAPLTALRPPFPAQRQLPPKKRHKFGALGYGGVGGRPPPPPPPHIGSPPVGTNDHLAGSPPASPSTSASCSTSEDSEMETETEENMPSLPSPGLESTTAFSFAPSAG